MVCDDGEPINIMEIEALGVEAANMPEPPTITSTIKNAAIVNAVPAGYYYRQ